MKPVSTHRAVALGLFRSSVFFVFAVAAFTEADRHTQTLLITGIFMIDVVSWHLCEVIGVHSNLVYNQTWFNVLADRFTFEKLLDRFRDRQFIDFPELVREGTQAARADIDLFLQEKTIWAGWGWFRKTLAGAGYFLWYWISYGIFYWIAAAVANILHP